MGFILDGLETESYDRTYTDRDLVRRILGYFWPHRRRMVLVAVMLTLNSAASSGMPILIAWAIDAVGNNPSLNVILLAAVGVLLVGALSWLFNYIRQMLSSRVVGDVVLKLREDVFDATVGHDLSFYDEHPSGKIVSRVTSDTQDFSDVVTLVLDLFSQVLLVIILAVWLFTIDFWLTLLLLGMSPVAVAIALSFRHVARRVSQNAKRVRAIINAQIQESISGIAVAKSFRQEQAVYDSFADNNRQAYRVGLQRGLTLNTIFPIMGMMSGIGTATLLYAGGIATLGGMSSGQWYLFMQAVGFFWWPLLNISSFWSQFQDGLAASERVFGLIDAEPKVVQTASEPVESMEGRLELRNLCFTYAGDEEDGGSAVYVLEDFDLEVLPGETVALVGHTGAGKSSIARLITRFYEFQDGELLVDGRDARTLDLTQYRHHLGLVPQEPFLFSGTVRDNIRYGQPDASDEEVYQAAVHVGRGDWLGDLPDGPLIRHEHAVGEPESVLDAGLRHGTRLHAAPALPVQRIVVQSVGTL